MSSKDIPKREKKSVDSIKSRKSSSHSETAGETPLRLVREGYELHELLGEGSYSKVYRATNQKSPGTEYACKRYKINKKTQKWVDRCLTREMNITMLVQHRNIVLAYEAISTKHEAFLILQYARNGSIRTFIKKLPSEEYLEEKKIRNWLSDIFSAVAYLHGKEIAHRDIKTENFLLDDEMRPLLCDFSFACMSPNPSTRFDCMVDTICGTTAYLAPEVHSLKRGQKYDAKLADIYALGVCMFEMVNKKLPFLGKYQLSDGDLVKRQWKKDYQFQTNVRISSEGRQLIDSLMDPNPRTRISINRALYDCWFKAKLHTHCNRSSSRSSRKSSSDNPRSSLTKSKSPSHKSVLSTPEDTVTGSE